MPGLEAFAHPASKSLALPMHTVSAERVFAILNYLRSDVRNRLEGDHLNTAARAFARPHKIGADGKPLTYQKRNFKLLAQKRKVRTSFVQKTKEDKLIARALSSKRKQAAVLERQKAALAKAEKQARKRKRTQKQTSTKKQRKQQQAAAALSAAKALAGDEFDMLLDGAEDVDLDASNFLH